MQKKRRARTRSQNKSVNNGTIFMSLCATKHGADERESREIMIFALKYSSQWHRQRHRHGHGHIFTCMNAVYCKRSCLNQASALNCWMCALCDTHRMRRWKGGMREDRWRLVKCLSVNTQTIFRFCSIWDSGIYGTLAHSDTPNRDQFRFVLCKYKYYVLSSLPSSAEVNLFQIFAYIVSFLVRLRYSRRLSSGCSD